MRRQTIREASQPQPSRVTALLPASILTRRPKLSTDNAPHCDVEIIVGESAGKTPSVSRSLQMVRKSVAPKFKKASISKLNEELDVKIQRQLHASQDERKREREQKAARQRECEAAEEAEDEFGESDGDLTAGDGSLGGDFDDQDWTPTLPTRIESEADEADRVEVAAGGAGCPAILDKSRLFRPRVRVESESESQSGPASGSESGSGPESDEDALRNLIEPDEPGLLVFEDHLTQMLSGRFPSSPREEQDEEAAIDAEDPDPTTEEEGRQAEPREYSAKGLIEEEAEDEDSDVSVDDVDEEAIARELQESAFLNDEEEEGEGEGSSPRDVTEQLVVHRRMLEEREAEEMEMFMNRFVPDEVLRETGVYAEIRKKYAEVEDSAAELRSAVRGRADGAGGGVSAFGRVKGFDIAPAQSHPEFLKLLEQDRPSSETEPETELTSLDEGGVDEECLDRDESRLPADSLIESLLVTSSAVIRQHSSLTVGGKRTHFSIEDELLRSRLVVASREKEDAAPADSKRGRTTFAAVSARPVIAKERMGKK